MISLFNNLSTKEVEIYCLVLASSGIPYSVIKKSHNDFELKVNDNHHKSAYNAIEQYLEENRDFPPQNNSIEEKYKRTYAGIIAAIFLLICHLTIESSDNPKDYIRDYGSSSSRIMDGEMFRATTSLMLHANDLHLLGNMVGIALFGTSVSSIMGGGIGFFLILFSGIAGNLLNALFFRYGHLSIGASTGVFGALGILAGYQFIQKYRIPGKKIRAWLPLIGGLALLSFLGSTENSDITAHLFGFAAGLALGILYTLSFKTRPVSKYQTLGYILTMAFVAMSWIIA